MKEAGLSPSRRSPAARDAARTDKAAGPALAGGQPPDLPALEAAMHLLGIERSEPECPWRADFDRITPI